MVLECELAAEAADPYRVRDKMEGNLARRKGCQPLSEPTCGSVFKNPEGASAGRLIEGAGCKGAEVGGAKVSELHGNFIVNRGGATAADVRALMEQVRAAVLASAGIELVPEVRMLGFDEDFPSARGADEAFGDEAFGDECARGAAGGTSAGTARALPLRRLRAFYRRARHAFR